MSGTGRIAVHATESLDASVPGTGSIVYTGNPPQVRKSVNGVGSSHQPLTMSEPEVADATRRTRLANERTYLAWLRSALTALAVAIGAGKIVPGVTDGSSWPFELLGAGFAVLALISRSAERAGSCASRRRSTRDASRRSPAAR